MNLGSNCKITRHNNAEAAATTDITPSSGIDMANFEGCLFMVPFGAITASAVTSIEVHTSSDDGVGDAYTALAGSSVTVADDDDNQIAWVDVYKPRERYLKLIVDRGTQNAVVDGIIAIQYEPRNKPTTHDSTTVLGGEVHVSPAEGTA
jgi:hypothetical protein